MRKSGNSKEILFWATGYAHFAVSLPHDGEDHSTRINTVSHARYRPTQQNVRKQFGNRSVGGRMALQ